MRPLNLYRSRVRRFRNGRRSVLAALLFSGLFLTTGAHAQEVQKITFSDAVQLALERNPTIRRARNNVELQSTNVTAEKANFLPNLNLSSGGSRSSGLGFDQTTFEKVTKTTESFNVGANSSINLFNGFADVASLESARKTLESQEYSFDRTTQTTVFNVIANYLSVMLAKERYRIQVEDFEAQQLLLDQIQEFVDAGVRAVSDLYTQQATLASSEAQLLDAEYQVEIAKTRLIQTLQIDPLGNYEFVAPNPDEIPLNVQEFNPEELMIGAFENRPDLRAQEASIDAAVQGIRIAKAGYLPRLNLSGSYRSNASSQAGQRVGTEFITTPFFDQLDENQSKSLSLSLSIPIFNRLQTKTAVESRRVQHANALLDLEAMQQSVAVDIRQAYFDYQNAAKQLDVSAKQLRAAEQALEVEQERYNVGASTLVELTQSRAAFTQASSQRIQAIFQFQVSLRVLDYYQGVLDPSQPLF